MGGASKRHPTLSHNSDAQANGNMNCCKSLVSYTENATCEWESVRSLLLLQGIVKTHFTCQSVLQIFCGCPSRCIPLLSDWLCLWLSNAFQVCSHCFCDIANQDFAASFDFWKPCRRPRALILDILLNVTVLLILRLHFYVTGFGDFQERFRSLAPRFGSCHSVPRHLRGSHFVVIEALPRQTHDITRYHTIHSFKTDSF